MIPEGIRRRIREGAINYDYNCEQMFGDTSEDRVPAWIDGATVMYLEMRTRIEQLEHDLFEARAARLMVAAKVTQ